MYFLFTQISCMDVPLSKRDLFSEQSNTVRRLFIFPVLKDSETLEHARNTLLSIALVSKKSYEQTMCFFFLKDVLKILGNRYIKSDACIANQLGIPRIQKYGKLNEQLFNLINKNKFSSKYIPYFAYAIYFQGANINFTISKHNVSLLMGAVHINSPALTQFLIEKGADCNAYAYYEENNKKQINGYVRDFNMIYKYEQLTMYLDPLYDHLFPGLQRSSSCFVNMLLGIDLAKTTPFERFDSFKRSCILLYPDLNASYKQFCFNKYELTHPIELRNALYIDSLLEKKGALSSFEKYTHPLIVLLEEGTKKRYGFVYKMVLRCIFDNDIKKIKMHTPKAIAKILREFDE